jgi:hypothetical protein
VAIFLGGNIQIYWINDLIDRLEPDLREDFEERAAIMEYDGGLPRDHAECLALLNILRKHPDALVSGKNQKEMKCPICKG